MEQAKKSGATHVFTNGRGETYHGRYVTNRDIQLLCKDEKTWMKEPICVNGFGVRSI